MPKGYWGIVIALGLMGAASSGQAQQAQSPQRDPAEHQEPAEILPRPFRVEIIEDQAEAEARQRREAEADQREIDDLVAQKGMNTATKSIDLATQDMRDYALYSTVAVTIGTFLLIANLYLTGVATKAATVGAKHNKRAAKAAVKAAKAAAVANELQNKFFIEAHRARLKIEDPEITDGLRWDRSSVNIGKFGVVFKVFNSGQTEAVNVSLHAQFQLEGGQGANEVLERLKSARSYVRGYTVQSKNEIPRTHRMHVELTSPMLARFLKTDPAYAEFSDDAALAEFWRSPIKVRPLLIVCVNYQLFVGEDWKHTWYSARLGPYDLGPEGDIGPYWGDTHPRNIAFDRDTAVDVGAT